MWNAQSNNPLIIDIDIACVELTIVHTTFMDMINSYAYLEEYIFSFLQIFDWHNVRKSYSLSFKYGEYRSFNVERALIWLYALLPTELDKHLLLSIGSVW